MSSFELLAPVGDFECLKAAVQNGANAVYLGASSFSARAKATNFDDTELLNAIEYAKSRNVSVHLALNTLIKDEEFEDAVKLAINAYNMGVDAIIIQDLGLASYLNKHYPEIPLHASTQMTIHNLDGVKKLEELGYKRVVLARELSINDIKYIRENTNIELEVFIHGALCISYSGQCLLSSAIGGRSGNRGLCAQPCRLKYELIEINSRNIEQTLDKGYLMSPKDTLGITFLPELIKLGINSFKIEGRMKTPYYVGVVTNIYRKYIDYCLANNKLSSQELKTNITKMINEKNEDTNLSDLEMLTQVFNRGGFSTGHFKNNANTSLIYKEKPNNMGFYLGQIAHVNENKGHISLKLENTLSIGDKVSINNESYTVSELMINNKNFETLSKGNICKIGRMKGDIRVGQKVYRIESQALNKYISPSFKEDKELKKILLNGRLIIKKDKNISFNIISFEDKYFNLEYTYESNFIPSIAQKTAATYESISTQINKTGSTIFKFSNLDIDLDDGLFIPNGVLNDIRRTTLDNYQALLLEKSKNSLEYKDISIPAIGNSNNTNTLSLLLNTINDTYDYSNLSKNINNIYIPLKFFVNSLYKNVIIELSQNYNIYIYMPTVNKNNYLKSIDFNKILDAYNVKGFIISHVSQFETLKTYTNYEFIGNYNLNTYNTFTIKKYNELKLCKQVVSPELTLEETNNLTKLSPNYFEVIIYGKLPVMTNNYCYLGCSNMCYKECTRKCNTNSKFYLKDRVDCMMRVIPDNTQTITTIYNSKTLSIKKDIFKINNFRIDIIDESIEEINSIIDKVINNERLEGKDYTNGNYQN